jgi:molybdopterin/thiamine biosynthesis adenylyltransferase/rhodanese-related sulfurtransferase
MTTAMQPDYSRQVLLKEVGADGQEKLARSRVLVIGAGGLGSPVLQYLAGAGVGCLGIVDADTLHASNLHRQPLYALAEIGRPKVELARSGVAKINPEVRVEIFPQRLDADNAQELVRRFDLVVECSDNFRTKFLVNDAAVLAQKPAVFASVYQYEGQLQVYKPQADHACLRCLWPEATADGIVGNCAEAGVLGPVPGALGALQALLALKILLGMTGQLAGELLLFDLTTFSTLKIKAPRCSNCDAPACARVREIAREPSGLEVRYGSLADAARSGFEVIDIRSDAERALRPTQARHIAMAALLANPGLLASTGRYMLVCASGKRSLAAARELHAKGFAVTSLNGGLQSLDA